MVLEDGGSNERLEAQAQLWNHLLSYIKSMSLECAGELGIPGIIHNHGKPISLSDLASAIPIPAAKTDHIHRLLRLLVHTGMLSISAEKQKGETENVEETFHVFDGLKSLVDVGGGTGAAALALAGAFPNTRGTVLDLPHVVAGLPADSSAGVNFKGGGHVPLDSPGRCSISQGPPLISNGWQWILHDWNDEECVKILQKCKEAIFPTKDGSGKVIILETVVYSNKNDRTLTETQLCLDFLMCTLATGKERDEGQWKKLFQEAGFSGYRITPILGLRSLIEVFPCTRFISVSFVIVLNNYMLKIRWL